MASPSRVETTRYWSWGPAPPFCARAARDRSERRCSHPASIAPAGSTTGPVRRGTVTSAAAGAAVARSSRARAAAGPRVTARSLELHLGSLGGAGGRGGELGPGRVVVEEAVGEAGGGDGDEVVEVLHRLDVAPAGHRDAVLGALELHLEVAE